MYFPLRDDKKKRLKPSSPNSERNNSILIDLLNKYNAVIADRKDITASELSCYFDKKKSHSLVSIDELIERCIAEEKKKTGCNYRIYEKLHRRLLEFHPDLANISISNIDEKFCSDFRDWLVDVRQKNYEKTTVSFMALLRRISNDKAVDWNIDNIDNYSLKNTRLSVIK